MQEDKLKDEQAKDNSVKAFVMPSFDSPRNWKEDYPHENGNYLCKCYQCNEHFYGHKRRPLCRNVLINTMLPKIGHNVLQLPEGRDFYHKT